MTDVNWELEDDSPVWCEGCEHWADDCVCEELCDHIRETVEFDANGMEIV